MWIQTGVTVRKRLSWVVTSVTLTFDLWPWPFAWTSLLSLVITPENFTMIGWWEHSQKGVTDRQTDRRTDRRTDGRTDWTIHRAAWSQLKTRKPRPSNINGTEVILKARYVRNLCRLYFCANILQHNSRWKCVYSSDREGQGLFQGQSTGPHSYHNDSPHGKAVSGGWIASGVTKLLLWNLAKSRSREMWILGLYDRSKMSTLNMMTQAFTRSYDKQKPMLPGSLFWGAHQKRLWALKSKGS